MTPEEILDISKDAIWVFIKISLPIMLIALVVGLLISLFQALTQIQEMTLTFVPKLLAIFIALILLLPFMGRELAAFSDRLSERIAGMQAINAPDQAGDTPAGQD
jgi:flagellar biosynthesis protein FliQ